MKKTAIYLAVFYLVELSSMVHPRRFERLTSSFGGKRSIQLS